MSSGPAARYLSTAIDVTRKADSRLDGRRRALGYLQAYLEQRGGLRREPNDPETDEPQRVLARNDTDQSPR